MQKNHEHQKPAENNCKSWIVVGDIHDRVENVKKIPVLPDLAGIIISGDLTQEGACPQAEKVLAALERPGLPLFAQIGNMDLPEVDACLARKSKNLHGQVYELAPDIAIFGIGGSTITPFNTPSEFTEEAYGAWLDQCWEKASKYPKRILISHNPPKDSACDRISSGAHVGSTAVRKFIEEKQPDICVCGHIHEAKSIDKLGKTLVLNPGMLSEGSYVLIRYCEGQLGAEIRNLE